MNVFTKLAAAAGAVVFTATAMGLPDVCRYCTARTMSAAAAHHVVASDGRAQPGRTTQVSLRGICDEHWHLPI